MGAGVAVFYACGAGCVAVFDRDDDPGEGPVNVVATTASRTPSSTVTTAGPTVSPAGTVGATSAPVGDSTTAPTQRRTTVAPTPKRTTPPAPPKTTAPGDAYYANCAAAKAAGAAPLYRGQPGYRSALDRDNDGVACET